MDLLQVLFSGLATGGIYALVAVGQALIWGLMGLVNFAHGDMLMVGMYVAYGLWAFAGIDPLASAPIAGLVMFGLGVLVYYLITSKVLKAARYAQIFATFGLAILLRSLAQFIFSPNYKMISNKILDGAVQIGSISIGKAQLVAGVVALILSLALYFLMSKTDLGRAMRATSEDKDIASVMGINSNRMFALAWGIAGACVGIAGGLMTTYLAVHPEVGSLFSLIAFVVVALGGFGSIPGALFAALLIGLVESFTGFYVAAVLKYVAVFAIYLIVILVRPKGLFGW